MCGSVRGALGNRRPYRDRTEADRKITERAVVVDAEKKRNEENEREKLFYVKRKKCVQKEFDRSDIVREVRLIG